MAHHHHWHRAAAKRLEPFADALRVISGGIDNKFAGNIAFFSVHDPLAVLARDANGRREAQYRRAEVTRALGQGLRQLRRVDVAIGWIIQRALEIVGLGKRIFALDLVNAKNLDIHALVATHTLGALKLLHALLGMRKAHGAGDVVVHRIVNRLGETAVKLGRIALHVHD